MSRRQARVPSPNGNTWAFWHRATDAQTTTLEGAWYEDTDESSDDEPPLAAYADHLMRTEADLDEASTRIHAKAGTTGHTHVAIHITLPR